MSNPQERTFRDDRAFRIEALVEFGVVVEDSGSRAIVHVPAHPEKGEHPALRFAAVMFTVERIGDEQHIVSSCRCCRIDADDDGEPCKSSQRSDYLCYHAIAAIRLLSEDRKIKERGLISVYWSNNAQSAKDMQRQKPNAVYGRFRPEGSDDGAGLPILIYPPRNASRMPAAASGQSTGANVPTAALEALQKQLEALQRQVAATAPIAPVLDRRAALLVAAGLDPTGFCEFTDDELIERIKGGGTSEVTLQPPTKRKKK